ncbi:MAG: tetratricopeptide repeat protein, partial [Pseudomonadota bacterium]
MKNFLRAFLFCFLSTSLSQNVLAQPTPPEGKFPEKGPIVKLTGGKEHPTGMTIMVGETVLSYNIEYNSFDGGNLLVMVEPANSDTKKGGWFMQSDNPDGTHQMIILSNSQKNGKGDAFETKLSIGGYQASVSSVYVSKPSKDVSTSVLYNSKGLVEATMGVSTKDGKVESFELASGIKHTNKSLEHQLLPRWELDRKFNNIYFHFSDMPPITTTGTFEGGIVKEPRILVNTKTADSKFDIENVMKELTGRHFISFFSKTPGVFNESFLRGVTGLDIGNISYKEALDDLKEATDSEELIPSIKGLYLHFLGAAYAVTGDEAQAQYFQDQAASLGYKEEWYWGGKLDSHAEELTSNHEGDLVNRLLYSGLLSAFLANDKYKAEAIRVAEELNVSFHEDEDANEHKIEKLKLIAKNAKVTLTPVPFKFASDSELKESAKKLLPVIKNLLEERAAGYEGLKDQLLDRGALEQILSADNKLVPDSTKKTIMNNLKKLFERDKDTKSLTKLNDVVVNAGHNPIITSSPAVPEKAPAVDLTVNQNGAPSKISIQDGAETRAYNIKYNSFDGGMGMFIMIEPAVPQPKGGYSTTENETTGAQEIVFNSSDVTGNKFLVKLSLDPKDRYRGHVSTVYQVNSEGVITTTLYSYTGQKRSSMETKDGQVISFEHFASSGEAVISIKVPIGLPMLKESEIKNPFVIADVAGDILIRHGVQIMFGWIKRNADFEAGLESIWQEKYNEAITNFTKALNTSEDLMFAPIKATYLYYLGVAYAGKGDYSSASDYQESAAELGFKEEWYWEGTKLDQNGARIEDAVTYYSYLDQNDMLESDRDVNKLLYTGLLGVLLANDNYKVLGTRLAEKINKLLYADGKRVKHDDSFRTEKLKSIAKNAKVIITPVPRVLNAETLKEVAEGYDISLTDILEERARNRKVWLSEEGVYDLLYRTVLLQMLTSSDLDVRVIALRIADNAKKMLQQDKDNENLAQLLKIVTMAQYETLPTMLGLDIDVSVSRLSELAELYLKNGPSFLIENLDDIFMGNNGAVLRAMMESRDIDSIRRAGANILIDIFE